MTRSASRRGARARPALVIAFLAASLSIGASSLSAQARGAPPDSLVCTIRAVDPEARSLIVLTGVGHSLRVIRMEVAPDCRIETARASARLGDLRPGEIVRVLHRAAAVPKRTTVQRTAVAIVVLPVRGSGGGR